MIRCGTLGFEVVINCIGFSFFHKVTAKFDRNIILLAILLGLAINIRNTIIIGWPVILLLKMIYEKAYYSIIISAVFFALPALCLMVLFDSIYYGSLTITLINFFKINVFENRSAAFGEEPTSAYYLEYMPQFLPVIMHLIIPALIYDIYVNLKLKKVPFISIFLVFYAVALTC